MIELKGTENAMALRGRSPADASSTKPPSWTRASGSKSSAPLWPTNKVGHYLLVPRRHRIMVLRSLVLCRQKKMTGNAGATQPSRKRTTRGGGGCTCTTTRHSARNLRRASRTVGLVAINFSDDNISKQVTDIPQIPLWIGLDFNVDNMSTVFGIRVGEDLHIFDELIMTNATTWDVADEINHRFGLERKGRFPRPRRHPQNRGRPHRPRHPPASASKYQRSPGKSATKSTASTPPSSTALERAACCHPRCGNDQSPHWSTTTTASPTKSSADHCFDALGYLCLMKFNLNKGIKVANPLSNSTDPRPAKLNNEQQRPSISAIRRHPWNVARRHRAPLRIHSRWSGRR